MRYEDSLDWNALVAYAQSLNSRARSVRAAGTLTPALLRGRILESAGRCEWCGSSLLHREFEIDHVINLARGGSNTIGNIAVACPDCNRRKSANHPARFAQEIIARTGQITPLIQRVLDYYEADAVPRQRSLFELTETSASRSKHSDNEDAQHDADRDADRDALSDSASDVPPYRW